MNRFSRGVLEWASRPEVRDGQLPLLLVLLTLGTLLLTGCGASGNDTASPTTEQSSSGQEQGGAETTVFSSEEDLEGPMAVEAPDIAGAWEVELMGYESTPGIGPDQNGLEEGNPTFDLFLGEPVPDDESSDPSDLLFPAKVFFDGGGGGAGFGGVEFGEDEEGETFEGGRRISIDVASVVEASTPLDFVEVNLAGDEMTGELQPDFREVTTQFVAQRVSSEKGLTEGNIEGQWEGTWYYDDGETDFDLDIGFTTEDDESLGVDVEGNGTYSGPDFTYELTPEGSIGSGGRFTLNYDVDGSLTMTGLVAGNSIQGMIENTTPEGVTTSDPFVLERVSSVPETTSE